MKPRGQAARRGGRADHKHRVPSGRFGSAGAAVNWSERRLSNHLLVGWRDADHAAPALGFPIASSADSVAFGESQPLLYQGDGHLLCLGPTGSGKGRGCVIPNLLLNDNPAVVVDVKGELAQVTARRRREMGHQVVVLDPFGVLASGGSSTGASDTFNPFDLFDMPDAQPDADAEMLAELIAGGKSFKDDPFWDLTARGILAGCLAHLGMSGKGNERSLVGVRRLMHSDDMDYEVAKLLDDKAVISSLARDEFVAYLSITSDRTRPCVRSTAQAYLKCLGSPPVMANLAKSSWRLQDLVDGKPLTVYLVIPPEKLASHRVLLRIWVGVLLTAIMRRRQLPEQRTILFLDEAATLGALTQLETAITLLRGYGVQTYTFWQDLSQISQLYPQSWQSIVNNSSASMQIFGVSNPLMARQVAELLGVAPEDVLRLRANELLLYQTGAGLTRCRRPDYLRDPLFASLFDANRRLESRGSPRAV